MGGNFKGMGMKRNLSVLWWLSVGTLPVSRASQSKKNLQKSPHHMWVYLSHVLTEESWMKKWKWGTAAFCLHHWSFWEALLHNFLKIATCSSSSCLELFHCWDGAWKPGILSDWEPAVQHCDGHEGELEVKLQVGSLHGSCVGFKYMEYNWELGHSKCKVGQKKKKEKCLRFILIRSSLFAYLAEFWTWRNKLSLCTNVGRPKWVGVVKEGGISDLVKLTPIVFLPPSALCKSTLRSPSG